MCLPYNQILLGSKRNPVVQVWEKSIRKVLREICKRLILLATIALCRRTLKSSCQERKKMPSPREQVQHQKRDTILKYFTSFLSTDGVWRSCHHRGCSRWLLLFQEVSRCSSNCPKRLSWCWSWCPGRPLSLCLGPLGVARSVTGRRLRARATPRTKSDLHLMIVSHNLSI